MPHFRMIPLEACNVLDLYKQRHAIDLDPPYQRAAIWDEAKQERFIDSIVNGFDVPKLYFHELLTRPGMDRSFGERRCRYSVIDGKQRLLALWSFIQGELHLPSDFVFFDDESIQAAGVNYVELMTKCPTLRSRFDRYNIPVTVVHADDDDFIEHLFGRLNIQMPLSAPEQRNALGGPLPYAIRKLAASRFFKVTASTLPNNRLRHYDIAAKILYAVHRDQFVSTKRADLHTFVRDFRNLRENGDDVASDRSVAALEEKALNILDAMCSFFKQSDPLLHQVGRATLYFHVFRIHYNSGQDVQFKRPMLEQFNDEITAARHRATRRADGHDEPITARDNYLREFDRYRQSINDATALREQYGHLERYLLETFDVQIAKAT